MIGDGRANNVPSEYALRSKYASDHSLLDAVQEIGVEYLNLETIEMDIFDRFAGNKQI